MRIKSKGRRRNSSGYGLEEDVCVAADLGVSDDGSLIHDLEDLGAGVGLLSQSDCLSADTAVREHGSGAFLGVHSSLDAHTAVYSSTDTGVRVTGGITITEPDCYCGSASARFHRVPAFVDSLGKGKRKIDDMFSLSCHDTSVSAQLLDVDGMNGPSFLSLDASGARTSNTQCTLSHMTPGVFQD